MRDGSTLHSRYTVPHPPLLLRSWIHLRMPHLQMIHLPYLPQLRVKQVGDKSRLAISSAGKCKTICYWSLEAEQTMFQDCDQIYNDESFPRKWKRIELIVVHHTTFWSNPQDTQKSEPHEYQVVGFSIELLSFLSQWIVAEDIFPCYIISSGI